MYVTLLPFFFFFFFFNDTATTEIYTLSLHDALPICSLTTTIRLSGAAAAQASATGELQGYIFVPSPARATLRYPAEARVLRPVLEERVLDYPFEDRTDRKSTRLNSSHANISYAVFCF